MPKTFLGLKPGVGPVLKVMANNADDPLTTPKSDIEKFLFNSEDRDYLYVKNIWRVEWNDPAWSNSNAFTIKNFEAQGYPEILTQSNCFDVVFVDSNGWQYERGWYKYQNSPARYRSRFWISAGHRLPIVEDATYRWVLEIWDPSNFRSIGGYFLVIEWSLPAGIWARSRLPAPQSTPGQRVLEISGTRCALAAPGYDVRTATPEQLIFSNTKRVIGCIASGEVTLSGTTGSVSIPSIPGADYFVDLQWNEPAQPRHVPYWREGSADINVRCRVNGSSLEFVSVASNVSITYHVYAYGHGTIDTTSPIQVDATNDKLMVWRGPATGPTAFRNIIFDSRFIYPRVISDQLFNAQEPSSYWGPSTFFYASRGYRPIIKATGFGLSSFSLGSNSVRNIIPPQFDTVGNGAGFQATITPTEMSFGAPSTLSSALYSLPPGGFPDEVRGRGVRMYAISV